MSKEKIKYGSKIREHLLVTAGMYAAELEHQGFIDIPGGVVGEEEVADVVIKIVNDYFLKNHDDECFDESFDIFVEEALINKFGVNR